MRYKRSSSQSLSENLTVAQLVKKFCAYYETRRFITVFTGPRHLNTVPLSHPVF